MFFYHKWLFLLQTIPMKTSILAFFLFCCHFLFSQNIGVNSTGVAPDNSAMLDIASTNKGLLIPRMPAALRLSISTPANSLLVFDTDSTAIFMYNGPLAKWERLNPTYNFNNIIMGNSVGDVLVWNGTNWVATPKCNLFTYIYKDADSDGHGDRCEPLFACAPFPCYVSDSLDRNDQDPSIYPGAPELCDNKDNDQDGQIDELPITGVGTVCIVGIGACLRSGTTQCIAGSIVCSVTPGTPSTEICDGIDNDCNGVIDNGVTLNTYYRDADGDGYGNPLVTTTACSMPSGYVANNTDCNDANNLINPGRTELCNGVDDNCNGTTDELWPLKGSTCTVGVGACTRTGVWVCNGAGTGLVCSATPGSPTAETCNGIDDNCDGIVDGITRSCYTGAAGTSGVGACRPGTQTCTAGTWGACIGQVVPSTEVCDNIDNDCNGVIDNGLTRSCYSGPVGTAGVGRCRSGTQNCSAGLWGACAGQVLPIPEILGNGIDDDCNGVVQ